jgi:sirohydrochlorin ferrochelatase
MRIWNTAGNYGRRAALTFGLIATVSALAAAQQSATSGSTAAATSASAAAAASTQTGILLLAHGGRANWNAEVERIAASANAQRPVEVAFGMASRGTIQAAVDRLQARGVKDIVAVPLFISSHSSVVTSTAYLLGLRADMPEDLAMFAKMDHGSHGAGSVSAPATAANPHAGHGAAVSPTTGVDGTKPVTHAVPIRLASALDDDPVVASILVDRAKALSTDQAHEVAIIVAHGPVEDDENDRWLKNMSSLAALMKKDTTFARIDVVTVRDDAGEPVRETATKELRGLVERARSEGHRVLIVPLLLSYGGIEAGIRRRLEGLDYTMGSQGLLPDERMASWVLTRVDEPRTR